MKRRTFSAALLACASGSPLAQAQAAGTPVEGTHFVRLAQPVPVPAGAKIEVIEFFWYGSPHCNSFEPALEAWVKKLPADVAFRRIPIALRDQRIDRGELVVDEVVAGRDGRLPAVRELAGVDTRVAHLRVEHGIDDAARRQG